METLEICCDASILKYPNGRVFGCAGAITTKFNIERKIIIPDCTNNSAELMAMYTAVKLAHEICMVQPYDVTIYADSKFVVYGMKVWMKKWLTTVDERGIIYNYNNEPVKNQELFMMILSYMITNNLKIKIRHQKGHVKFLNEKSLRIAGNVFYESNGYRLDHDTLVRISLYNDKIDKNTKNKLLTVNPDEYPIVDHSNDLIKVCNYTTPYNFEDYVL